MVYILKNILLEYTRIQPWEDIWNSLGVKLSVEGIQRHEKGRNILPP